MRFQKDRPRNPSDRGAPEIAVKQVGVTARAGFDGSFLRARIGLFLAFSCSSFPTHATTTLRTVRGFRRSCAALLERAREALGETTTRGTVERALRLVADSTETERARRAANQRQYLKLLSNRVDVSVLTSKEMWR